MEDQTENKPPPFNSSDIDRIWEAVSQTKRKLLEGRYTKFLTRVNKKYSLQLSEVEDATARRNEFLQSLTEKAGRGYKKDCSSSAHLTVAFVCSMSGDPAWKQYILTLLGTSPKYKIEKEESRTRMDGPVGKMQRRINGILHEVARRGYCLELQYYLGQIGKAIDARNNIGETALHFAVEYQHPADVKVLLEKGAVFQADDYGWTPLHSAAMSLFPSAEVAVALTEKCGSDVQLLNEQTKSEKNTALHIAAGNANVTAEFIAQFQNADPLLRNGNGYTAFHLAADTRNPDTILHMLGTFAPICSGWSLDVVDKISSEDWSYEANGRRSTDTTAETDDEIGSDKHNVSHRCGPQRLIDICAVRGNADGVAALIRNGADISKGVLHKIVIESVKSPEKVKQLLAVYRAVVDNAVTWNCLRGNTKRLIKCCDEYEEVLRETMIGLITDDNENYDNYDVLEYAIQYGAYEMFCAILNTKRVFRISREEKQKALFDVTDFTLATTVEETTPCCVYYCSEKKIPYLRMLLTFYDEWLDTNILNKEPIKELCKPYVCFMKRYYMFLGVIQLIFMIFFSTNYLPNSCLLVDIFGANSSNLHSCNIVDAASPQDGTALQAPSRLWLVWPAILCIISISSLLHRPIWIIYVRFVKFALHCVGNVIRTRRIGETCLAKILRFLLQISPMVGFYVSVFVWYRHFTSRTSYVEYLEVTAMVFLFGWLTTLYFLSGVTNAFCMFSLLLEDVIVKDIVQSFVLVFGFVIVGFSFALHTLRLIVLPVDGLVRIRVTFYDIFAAAFGIGDFLEETRAELAHAGIHFTLLEAVFMCYMCFTAIILLNVLIAMLNNRYEVAKRRAENFWSFEIIRSAMELERFRIFRDLFRKSLANSFDDEDTSCCSILCLGCCCYCRHDRVDIETFKNSGRYLLKVTFEIDRPDS